MKEDDDARFIYISVDSSWQEIKKKSIGKKCEKSKMMSRSSNVVRENTL